MLTESTVGEYVSFVDKIVHNCMSWGNCPNSIGIPKHVANIKLGHADLEKPLEKSFQSKQLLQNNSHQIYQNI